MEERLLDAARDGDRGAVAQLVSPDPLMGNNTNDISSYPCFIFVLFCFFK